MNLDLFRLRMFVTVVDRNGYCGTELLRYQERAVHLTAAGREIHRTALVMLTGRAIPGHRPSTDELANWLHLGGMVGKKGRRAAH